MHFLFLCVCLYFCCNLVSEFSILFQDWLCVVAMQMWINNANMYCKHFRDIQCLEPRRIGGKERMRICLVQFEHMCIEMHSLNTTLKFQIEFHIETKNTVKFTELLSLNAHNSEHFVWFVGSICLVPNERSVKQFIDSLKNNFAIIFCTNTNFAPFYMLLYFVIFCLFLCSR